MKEINIATAQFQTRKGDKEYNFSRMEALTAEAAGRGARMVSFHEICITSYNYLQHLDRSELLAIAEEVPSGERTEKLSGLARRT